MLTLGLAGGLDPAHDQVLDVPENYTYDGGAVLVRDGRIVAAAEEERLNRIKHSNKFPVESIKFCLAEVGVSASDVDRFAYYVDENAANALLKRLYLANPDFPFRADARTMMSTALSFALGCEIGPDKLAFYPHKLTHAAAAAGHSGFTASLVYVVDSAGGLFEASWGARGELRLDELVAIPPARSMNLLWEKTLPFLGLGLFDEYKATALAAHGDPETFRPVFENVYQLLPDGDYTVNLAALGVLADRMEPRREQDEPSPAHADLAAALQRATEEIVLHVARYYREKTGQRALCLAGGMIENTQTAGRILRSGLFDDVFVHPAAYDSGCAVGAALLAASEGGDKLSRERVEHVYWGTGTRVEPELSRWRPFLEAELLSDPSARTAELLAEGEIVGWHQGRAEFGSHPLGNRSILADPRSADSRARVSAATGRHEPYRPFAASVLEERAAEFAELPAGPTPFLTFAVAMRPECRELLPAVTQVDGTARLHTVSRWTNRRYWELLTAFGERTGVPVLLNTSLNSAGEPTVDSVSDALVTFLTSDLDALVVGDYLVRRREPAREDWLALEISLPDYVKVFHIKGKTERDAGGARHEIRTSYDPPVRHKITPELAALLDRLDHPAVLGDLTGGDELLPEVRELWARRLIRLSPGRTS